MQEWNLDGLVEMIWDYLGLLRIYTKPKVGTASASLGQPHICSMSIAMEGPCLAERKPFVCL